MRFILSFRYRIKIKGLDKLNAETLNKPGGILFMPNHPTIFVDPTLVVLAVWKKFPIRPLIVEYMYYMPVVNWIMRYLNSLPIPNFVSASNSLKKKKADKVIENVIEGLKNKDNFLIYPAGKVKHQAREIISGSGVHRILQSYPDTNVVLVRTTGLWGSSFSRALGKTPFMFPNIFKGIAQAFKSLLFFLPKREVTLEFVPAPADFPYQGTRLEMNRYLENWYNQPDGLSKQEGDEPGETLNLVSYSMWKKEIPEIVSTALTNQGVAIEAIPIDVQEKVKSKLSEMTQMPVSSIKPEMNLGTDLGLDSLDNAELISFLDDQFEVSGVPVSELTTVGKLMGLASKQLTFGEQVEEELHDLSAWLKQAPEGKVPLPKGNTIPEAFLNTCQRMKSEIACGDMRAGVLTYDQAKLRVLLLADYIRYLPGEYIGILLPSSVAAYLTILACQLAGKVPLMVNWTVGPRHLETVVSLSKVQVVLSSWSFIDRLENVDLNGIEDLIVMLEDVAIQHFSIFDKFLAFFRSKKSTKSILKLFNAQDKSEDDKAVLLFTSGTESMPKGVPLTHKNILTNQAACIDIVKPDQNDVMLGILPPFHSFGFTLSGLLPLVSGFRAAYYPDPTDGKGGAKSIERWKATILCGAPSFLKGILKNGTPDQLKTLRLCFTGAEKAPQELFQLVEQLEHCKLGEGYGITECSPVLTINLSGKTEFGVGKVIPGSELTLVNLETQQPVRQGEQGLILAKGPNIFGGYLNIGLASPFMVIDNEQWYSTGDLGHLDIDGNLILSGRLKRFIKIGGEMISLAAIEDALHRTIGEKSFEGNDEDHGPILAVCAKEEAGEKAKIFVFTRFASSVEELNKSLREAGFSNLIKVYMVQQLPEIPIMGTGKINYRALETKLPSLLMENGNSKLAC
jgi:long-chain-fatty-acid--[acyl-carrier-protein] ligase